MLDHLKVGVPAEILLTLHQRHRVRIDFSQFVDGLSGQRGENMRDALFLFADYPELALTEHFMILQQAACYGILDRHNAYKRRIALKSVKHIVERVKRHSIYLPIREILPGGGIMETPGHTLYRYFQSF